jgi:HK97 family phage prohead protease
MLKTYTRPLEIKELKDSGEFEGYGSIFDVEDNGGDVVVRGAFRNSISSKPLTSIKMLFQHDPAMIIGKWEELREDERGLYVKGQIIPAIAKGAEVLAMMQAKVLDGLSIGFRTVKSELDHETYSRKLLEVDLWEVSVVTFPMNTQARVDAVKNATPRDVEKTLRDAGYPNAYAKAVANHGAVKANELMGKQRDAAVQADVDFVRNLWR